MALLKSESPPVPSQALPAAQQVRLPAVSPVSKGTRRLIWLYFILLFAEGPLRKWLVPQLSAPLAVARDPVLLLLYIFAFRDGKFTLHPMIITCLGLGVLSFLASLLAEWGTLTVSLYGFRTNFFHLPLISVMANTLTREDLLKFGRWCLWLLPPIAFLMVIQFLSSPDAWINTTSGGEGVQIAGGSDSIRPPGVFTFATGVAEYFAVASAFLIYGAVTQRDYRRLLIVTAAFALVTGMAVSISRLNLTSVGLVVVMLLIAGLLQPVITPKFIPFAILGALAFGLLSQTKPIQKALVAFNERIDNASDFEDNSGGFTGRISRTLLSPFDYMWEAPALGWGLGAGTNAGSKMLTGEEQFLLAEDEWSRNVLESGPIFGVLFVFWRLLFLLYLGRESIKLAARGLVLPILLFGACAPLFGMGQLGRPTTLGFAMFSTGLCFASIRILRRAMALPVISTRGAWPKFAAI